MRLFISFLLFACLTGCATTSDGPFYQVEGHSIDYEAVDSLVENKSTIENMIVLLGKPMSRELLDGELEKITYVSTKRRDSEKRILGVVRERKSQLMEEMVILIFKDNLLIQKNKSYVVH